MKFLKTWLLPVAIIVSLIFSVNLMTRANAKVFCDGPVEVATIVDRDFQGHLIYDIYGENMTKVLIALGIDPSTYPIQHFQFYNTPETDKNNQYWIVYFKDGCHVGNDFVYQDEVDNLMLSSGIDPVRLIRFGNQGVNND